MGSSYSAVGKISRSAGRTAEASQSITWQQYDVTVDEILVASAVLRMSRESGWKRWCRYDKNGVKVNARLSDDNPRILRRATFARATIYPRRRCHGEIVIQKCPIPPPLGLGYASVESLIMPWCNLTEGRNCACWDVEKDAREKGRGRTYTYKLDEVDRAILDARLKGSASAIQKGSDKILGATIVRPTPAT